MYIFCLRVCGRIKGFHFASKGEGKVGLPIFHPWVKGLEEKDVLEITEGDTESRGDSER